MKKGCLFLLLVFGLLTYTYHQILQGTVLSDKWWVAALLALSVVFVVGNFQGILLVFRQRRASMQNPRDWKDGQLVGVSGRVQAQRSPIEAPFSGRSAVIVEYEVRRVVVGDESTSRVTDCMGMLMVPCTIHTQRGGVRLIGFPLPVNSPDYVMKDDASYQRAGNYINATTFKEKSKNPFKIISELNAILSDDDGEVKEDFMDDKNHLKYMIEDAYYNDYEDEDLNKDESLESDVSTSATVSESETDEENDNEDADASELIITPEIVTRALKSRDYELNERAILNGSENTVFGTYIAAKQAINIGSSLKNIQHSLQPGSMSAVLGKNLKRGVLGTLFWGAVCFAANYYTLGSVGIDLSDLVKYVQSLTA